MRKVLTALLVTACLCIDAGAEYTDHRGHNVDSLEAVMAQWTAKDLDEASEEQMKKITMDLEELMSGFNQINGVKSEYYARLLLKYSRRFGWPRKEEQAAKGIGQHFWAKEQYDSAAKYYGIAMKAVEKMSSSDPSDPEQYSPEDIDDALSQMYGTLGNLYSMMDSISTAMSYYEKAGEIFRKHDWYNSCAVLYYNMGETMREDGQLRPAEKYYHESLDYSLLSADSLAIATAYKGLGSLYLDMHRTSKAMRYLADANLYFADHEDEELRYRMESLDYTSQVLAMQKRRLSAIILLIAVAVLLGIMSLLVVRRLRKEKQEKCELAEVLENTVETISVTPDKKDVSLKPKELQVLSLIAKGYTNADIAEAMCLSPETIKWYKKKLFAMFDASNSAELVRIATDRKLLEE